MKVYYGYYTIFICSEKFLLFYVAREATNLQDRNRVYRSRIPLARIYATKCKKSSARHFSSLSNRLASWSVNAIVATLAKALFITRIDSLFASFDIRYLQTLNYFSQLSLNLTAIDKNCNALLSN